MVNGKIDVIYRDRDNTEALFPQTVTNAVWNSEGTKQLPELLNEKVDKEAGKGLSTEDFTTAEQTKLAGIADGAEVNVQSDWNETDTTSDAFILNKPTLGALAAKDAIKDADVDASAAIAQSKIANLGTDLGNKVDKVSGKGLSTNDFTDTLKNKLDGISAGSTKVEASTTNGNIKIDGAEKTVYTLPTMSATEKGGAKLGTGLELVGEALGLKAEQQIPTFGTAGQYLKVASGGATLEWGGVSGAAGGTVTEVRTGDGLTGGPIITDGEISVDANTPVTSTNKVASMADIKLDGVQVAGTDLIIDASKKVNVPKATNSSYGVVKPGEGLEVETTNNTLKIKAPAGGDLGGVKSGSGLSIAADGTINHSNSVAAGTAGTTSSTNGVTADIPYVTYDAQGHITATGTHVHTVPVATSSSTGVVKVGDGLTIDASGNVVVNIKDNVTSTDTDYALSANQGKVLQDQISALSGGMVFKGQVNSTTPLPAASATTKGHLYYVGEDGTYQSISAHYGDLLICNDVPTWVHIPAQTVSGTVTSVTAGQGLALGSGTEISTTGEIKHANIGTSGTYYKVTTDAMGHITSGSASLVAADIPNLGASKITSGTLDAARLPIATSTAIGGVRAGSGVTIDATGKLDVTAGGTGTVTEVRGENGLTGTVTTSGALSLATSGVTAGTYPKVTVDQYGRVTSGANLDASDIPNLTLNKITDVTATVTEVNYVDGVTAPIQDQLNAKQATLTAGTGIGISGATISNAGVRSVTQDAVDGHKLTIDTNGVSATITIPDNDTVYDDTALSGRVTTIESKEAGWNAKYDKPSAGIPKTDLASAVQASLGLADTALQTHQSLANYSTTAEMNAAIAAHHDSTKQDTLTEGSNITITGNTISATDTTYTAANGVSLTGTTFENAGVRSIAQDSVDGHKLTINTGGTSATITIPDNDTTYSVFTATADGLVPKVTDTTKFLKGDGTWAEAGKTYTANNGVEITAADVIQHTNSVTAETAGLDTATKNLLVKYDAQGHISEAPTQKDRYGTVTLTTTWTGSAAPYTQEVATPAAMGITADDNPVLDVLVTDNTTVDDELTAWSKVYKAETDAGKITFYATEATTTEITVQIKN